MAGLHGQAVRPSARSANEGGRSGKGRSGLALTWRTVADIVVVAASAGLVLTFPEQRALVVALAAIAFWALAILPEDLTALVFFAAAMLLAVAPAEVVFSGFHSTAVWLVFGGLIIGAAVSAVGLDHAIAHRFRPLFRGSYARCVALTVLLAIALAFLVPSTMTRVILLVPVVAALADELGYGEESNGRTGLLLAAILASYYPAVAILPAAVPTVALVGAADAIHDVRLTYGAFLATHGPTLGALKAVLLTLVVVRLLPATTPRAAAPDAVAAHPARPRLAVMMAAGLVLWATDALHGISPAWIALALGVLCVLPGIGVLDPSDLQKKVNLRPAFYVAAILGVGAVLAESGVGTVAVDALAARGWLAPGRDVLNTLVLAVAALATGAMATMPGIAAVLVPIAGDIAEATGLDLEAVFRAFVLGYSTAILPYQVPPMVVGLGLAGISIATAARVTLVLAALSFVVVWPSTLLWWWLIA